MKAVFSSKADGSMKHQDGAVDLKNIKKFLLSQKMPQQIVCMHQVHGGDVVTISDNRKEVIDAVDGLVTNVKQLTLNVITADCLPILFYDRKEEVIGVAHAGRKGLRKNIIKNVITKMKKHFGSVPENIIVLIGPSIEKLCYEVGEDIINEFHESFPGFQNYFSKEDGKYFLDLRTVALQCLVKEGILKENIEISTQCTKCDENNYYSYRRGDINGRFVSSISLL